ncbi:hypothetical protein [Streptomyces sp. NPDC020362]|uniref:hypothetical protein n=1 Tax=unclassified Streptomyces TaxID=2593676 RepID=UPI000A5D20CD
MTAQHEGAAGAGGREEAGELGGMDALLAAITGEPLSQEARRDTAFLAAHRSAEADMAVLREQLTWLAEALTGELLPANEAGGPGAGEPEAGGPEAAGQEAERHGAQGKAADGKAVDGKAVDGPDADGASGVSEAPAATGKPATGESGGAGETGGTEETGGIGGTGGTEGTGGARGGVPRTRSVTRPVGPARPARPPRPGRPSGPRRALRIALGSLAAGGAFAMAAGFGWLVTHSSGGDMKGGSSADSANSAAKGAENAPAKVSGDEGRPADPALVLACYRTVVEGTVAEAQPQPDSPWIRIVLSVNRSYKPARTPAEVTFVLDEGAEPAPRKGQHVLVGIGQGQDNAGLWAVGDARVAVNRAWITETLPEARRTTCPSGEAPTDKP